MPSGTYNWSQTAGTNAAADSAIGWAEGQAPSSINDSARAMMAVLKKHDDDISGAIVTGGSSTAFTVTSYSSFASLALMANQMIAFTPHTTSGATVTLNVDSLGAKPLRSAPNTELLAGTLIAGTPYIALYNSSDAAFYLHGFYGNAYNVPLLAGMDYWDTVTPNSSFIFPAGQAISRVTYSAAFARWGTTYGAGDGSTTFNVPDKTGRVSVMKEASANRLNSTYFGDSTTLGAVGGSQSHTLATNEIPSHTHANTLNDLSHTHTWGPSGFQASVAGSGAAGTTPQYGTTTANTGSNSGAPMSITNAAQGGGLPHSIVQPTIVSNYVIRII